MSVSPPDLSTPSLDALLSVPRLGPARISPDGKWLAWTWAGLGADSDVFAAPADGSAPATRLTSSTESTWLVSWAPDSRSVVVGQDHSGDERVQLLRVELDRPLEPVALTESRPPYFLRGGELAPDGRYLVYGMNYDVEAGHEIEATWIYRHDLVTGERVPLARPERASIYAPELSPDGRHVLYTRQDLDPAGSQVWLVDSDGSNDREILNFGAARKVTAEWLPDSARIVFVAEHMDEASGAAYRRVGIWHLADESTHLLLDDPASNIEDAYPLVGGSSVVALDLKAARIHATLLDPETGSAQPIEAGTGEIVPLGRSGAEWIGRYASATMPGDLVRFDPRNTGPATVTSLTGLWEHTAVRPAELAPAEDFRWPSVDGLEVQGWLYRTPQPARGTIVYVHGGPTSYSGDRFNPAIQYFLTQGFHVLDPNYRGSTGFGLAYQEAIKEDGWGGREQEDIRTGIEALIAAGIAQPGRVGITGTSYGGYSSWCAITRFPIETLAAAVPICGMTDLVVDYETTRPDLRPYSEEMMGGRPDQVPERYHERSPIHFVRNIRGRLLIVQGLRDPNVTPANVEAVRTALDAAGIAYEVLAFPDEGHGIARQANRHTLYQRMVEFFSQAFDEAGGS